MAVNSNQDFADVRQNAPQQKTGAYVTNFAGTKYWKGGSSQISNYAGTCRTAPMTSAKNPGRHPEGVKGGNSQFPKGPY